MKQVWFNDPVDFGVPGGKPRRGWLGFDQSSGRWYVLTDDGLLHSCSGPIGEQDLVDLERIGCYETEDRAREAAINSLRRQLDWLPEARTRSMASLDQQEAAMRAALRELEAMPSLLAVPSRFPEHIDSHGVGHWTRHSFTCMKCEWCSGPEPLDTLTPEVCPGCGQVNGVYTIRVERGP